MEVCSHHNRIVYSGRELGSLLRALCIPSIVQVSVFLPSPSLVGLYDYLWYVILSRCVVPMIIVTGLLSN